MSDLRTLGEIAVRTGMLTVACSRRERRGRYRLDTLIARHGADAGMRIIVPELTADCPQRDFAALMETVGRVVSRAGGVVPGSLRPRRPNASAAAPCLEDLHAGELRE